MKNSILLYTVLVGVLVGLLMKKGEFGVFKLPPYIPSVQPSTSTYSLIKTWNLYLFWAHQEVSDNLISCHDIMELYNIT